MFAMRIKGKITISLLFVAVLYFLLTSPVYSQNAVTYSTLPEGWKEASTQATGYITEIEFQKRYSPYSDRSVDELTPSYHHTCTVRIYNTDDRYSELSDFISSDIFRYNVDYQNAPILENKDIATFSSYNSTSINGYSAFYAENKPNEMFYWVDLGSAGFYISIIAKNSSYNSALVVSDVLLTEGIDLLNYLSFTTSLSDEPIPYSSGNGSTFNFDDKTSMSPSEGEGFLSKIPLPENAGQAMAGLLIPGILSIILGILGQSGAAVAPSGGSGSSKAKAGSAYDFGDGRDYYEGQSYTFDNGKKYKIDNGEFVPTAGLRDGEVYIDPDGNRKIWIGGQAWHESDWRRQVVSNAAYSRAHKQDVDSYWAKRQQEIHEEQAAMHEKSEAEKAKDKEIEDQRKKVKELIRKTIEIQMDIDRTRRDIANRSAAYADRAYRGAQAIKYVCDKSIDIAAKIPGPKGEAFKAIRKAYRVTSAMAGGVGEGMASGNWSDSMVDATGAAVSNIIEDSIQTNRYKKGFEVFRGGTGEAWQQGRKAYRKGESIAGAAATGFVEGAAAEASKKAKEALEELAPGSKYSYTIGESSFKAGYKEYKKGGDIGDVMRASGSGYIDGGIDAAMDYGVGKIFENVLPEKVSEKTLADHIKYIEELEEQGIWMELYDTNRFPELKEMLQEDFTPEIIYDEIRKVADEVATKATQNVVKGKAFDDKLFA
jgi:hypothetical protein